MTNPKLEADYVTRAGHRLEALRVLLARGAHADVMREAQEIIELCLKALLRASGVTVPQIHDVGAIIVAEAGRLPATARPHAHRMAEISKALRKDREIAFYGSEDLIPSEFYTRTDADRAFADAEWVLEQVARIVLPRT
ncbi:MAG: HEPN domain-containing protein [Deltaproteobacteria bacterium]|nr:HEPN domain-containing protein [Deltaproteobacteria bacterium]